MRSIGKIIEIVFPYCGLIIAIIILKIIFKEVTITIELMDVLLESIFSIVTTLVGFLITTLTIFITFIKSRIIQYLKLNKLLNRVIYFFCEPIIVGIALIGIIIFLVINVGASNVINTNYFIFGMSMLILFLCSVLRVGTILFIVFSSALNDSEIIEI